jgi:hypothetical protein
VTSLARLLGRALDVREVASAVTRHFGEVFDREVISVE